MKNRFKNVDVVFVVALFLGLVFLCAFLLVFPYFHDETFYITIPFRLINGESLIGNEWHCTQFSSLFSYLPTWIWIKLTGSTEGIIVFMRCVYLSIQVVLTIAIYLFFRTYGMWAIMAALLFFTQFLNMMWQISYHSMFVCFLLLLSFSIISIHKQSATHLYIFAGICYASCCVCNPLFCFVFLVYLAVCVLWKYRQILIEVFVKLKVKKLNKTLSSNKTFSKKRKRKRVEDKEPIDSFKNLESYNCFFSKKAIIYLFLGVLIVAVIAISFFFLTGGTISSLFSNVENMLMFSEYNTRTTLFTNITLKISSAYKTFNSFACNKSFLFPLLFMVLIIDKKRSQNTHRCVYLLSTFLIVAVYSVGILRETSNDVYFMEFPFFVFSIVCYIVTNKKNTTLFYCMWIPCAIAAVFHFFSSNSLLSSINIVIIINNTAGVFFIADLFKEIIPKERKNSHQNELFFKGARSVLCLSLCAQLFFHLCFFQMALYTPNSNIKANTGPYAGINMTEKQFDNYTKSISDLDLIKSRTEKNSPIYIAGFQNWMYLHMERPIGVHTTYYLWEPSPEAFHAYFKENPDYIPEYIYIPLNDYFNNRDYDYPLERNLDILNDVFEFNQEELSNGLLLKVIKYKAFTE